MEERPATKRGLSVPESTDKLKNDNAKQAKKNFVKSAQGMLVDKD